MSTEVTGKFLTARFAGMLAGFLLLVGSFGLFTVVADQIGNDVLRWFTGAVSLTVGLGLAYAVNSTVLRRIDPDGVQREAVATGRRRTGVDRPERG